MKQPTASRDLRRRLAPQRLLPVAALALLLAGIQPAHASHFARLSGGVDVSCDGPSAEFRAEVRNVGQRPITLTHALLYVYTHSQGQPRWNQPAVFNLIETQEATPNEPAQTDPVLDPGEQKGRIAQMSLVAGVDRVFSIIWVHVQGGRFWRYASDLDSCQ